MNWNYFFNGVTAFFAAIGTGAIVVAVRQFYFSTWLKAQEIFTGEYFTTARGVVLQYYCQSDKVWTEENKKKRVLVCAKMDELARLVPFISKKKVLETWDDPMGKCWHVLQDFVIQERQETSWEVKWKAFEDLGKEALARVNHRENRQKNT
jgi:hypothetical protein